MDKKICGDFPEFCYKGFDCAEYANSFMNEGTLRMGCLPSYRYVENNEAKNRRDPTEGIACTKEPGDIIVGLVSPDPAEETIKTSKWGHREVHTEFGGPVFCFCTSLPEVNLEDMFNDYKAVVRINDPRKLAEDILDHYISKGQSLSIEGCRIVYNKGQKLGRKLTDNERVDLSYSQKPAEGFSDQCEFRIVVFKFDETCPEECKSPSGEFKQKCDFKVKLGKPLDYLSLVPRQ